MIDKDGNKYYLLNYESVWWSLGYDGINERLSNTCWFCLDDYEIYSVNMIRKKHNIKKEGKYIREKIKSLGYVQLPGVSYNWYVDWFIQYINCPELIHFLEQCSEKQKINYFYDFLEQNDILHHEEPQIENWWKFTLAIKWCKDNNIVYEIDYTDFMPEIKPDENMRKEIIMHITSAEYTEPFRFMNNVRTIE